MRASRIRRMGALPASLVFWAAVGWAQQLVIRTAVAPLEGGVSIASAFGKARAKVESITPANDLLIVLDGTTLSSADGDASRRLAVALWQAEHGAMNVRVAITTPAFEVAGPFRTAAELSSKLRRIALPDTTAVAPPDPGAWIAALATTLEAESSAWGETLVIGHFPDFAPNASAEAQSYAVAWAAQRFIAQRRSMVFAAVSSQPRPEWITRISRATGGSSDDPAASVPASGTLTRLSWDAPKVSAGFILETARIEGVPELAGFDFPAIAAAAGAALPDIAQYADLRERTARIGAAIQARTDLAGARMDLEAALRVNPSDAAAVRLGIEMARADAKADAEIPLLRTLIELTPEDASAWNRLGDLAYARKEFAAAEPALLRARELGVANAKISKQLGRIRYEAGDYAHAGSYIDESLARDSRQQELWFLAADVARRTGNTEKRIAALERALALGGVHVEERADLIHLYLSKHDNAKAARHADLEVDHLPAVADVQATWANFYEQLSRPRDALAAWNRVARIDPKREDAWVSITSILLALKQYQDVVDAADQGLSSLPGSARVELARVTALESLDRIYEARQSLEEFTATPADIDLLRRRAALADLYGGAAPHDYRALAEALETTQGSRDEIARVNERGWRVSLREGDVETANWFGARLPDAKAGGADGSAKNAGDARGVWVPGGLDALMFIAHGNGGRAPSHFFFDYSRTIIANEATASPQQIAIYQKGITSYFEQVKALMALGTTKTDRTLISLSLADKKSRAATEQTLNLLGWRLRRNKQELTIESIEKASQTGKQDVASALAIDQAGMQDAFQNGKPFSIEIPQEYAPSVMDAKDLSAASGADKLPGGVAEALARDPNLARLYIGMSSLDRQTAAALESAIGLKQLSGKYATLFAMYSSALAVNGGRVVVPGGAGADPVWTKLAGAPPTDPGRFLKSLFEKDDGKLLAFLFTLSQLDTAHQRFFTLAEHRTAAFYELFQSSEEMQAGAGRLVRNGSFSGFLREIPIEDGHVDFPGSPEAWMVAKGQSKSASKTEKLLKKMRKTVAPDVEDEILVRLAKTRYNKADAKHASELDNFLAIVRIDAHRADPMDEESALLLAQNYGQYANFYPYFASFRELNAQAYRKFFEAAARVYTLDPLSANLMLGHFESLVEILRLAMESGQIAEHRANTAFVALCERFAAAADAAAWTEASLATIRDIAGDAPDVDKAVEAAVLGRPATVDFEIGQSPHSLDPARQRAIAYGRVLDEQKITRLAPLLDMDAASAAIAEGKPPAALIERLKRDAAELATIEIPKSAKSDGKQKVELERENSAKAPQIIAEMQQKTAKKKVNPADLSKLRHDLLDAIAPQTQIALTGIVYAAYMQPEDALAANDPLLARKHRFFDFEMAGKPERFAASDLNVRSEKGGSYFVGGFGQFAEVAGRAASLGAGDGKDRPQSELFATQIGAIRITPWARYSDDDQRLLGMRIRMAREWCVYASTSPALRDALGEEMLGIVSLSRRREVLAAIASGDWQTVWSNLSLSDLLALSGRYTARFDKSPWNSPLDATLRRAMDSDSSEHLDLLGAVPVALYGCDHAHLVEAGPYEEYERRLFPAEIAERTSEYKLYLSELLDRLALPAAILPAIAETAARRTFRSMAMSDDRDWEGALKAFAGLDVKTVNAALETK